jgi:hypothetical protein
MVRAALFRAAGPGSGNGAKIPFIFLKKLQNSRVVHVTFGWPNGTGACYKVSKLFKGFSVGRCCGDRGQADVLVE